jgi:hypothetical protein
MMPLRLSSCAKQLAQAYSFTFWHHCSVRTRHSRLLQTGRVMVSCRYGGCRWRYAKKLKVNLVAGFRQAWQLHGPLLNSNSSWISGHMANTSFRNTAGPLGPFALISLITPRGISTNTSIWYFLPVGSPTSRPTLMETFSREAAVERSTSGAKCAIIDIFLLFFGGLLVR